MVHAYEVRSHIYSGLLKNAYDAYKHKEGCDDFTMNLEPYSLGAWQALPEDCYSAC